MKIRSLDTLPRDLLCRQQSPQRRKMQEQTAEEQKEEEQSYFAFFDKETNNGVVFDEDLSILPELPVDSLTNVEHTAQQNWLTVRRRIQAHFWKPRILSDLRTKCSRNALLHHR